MGLPPRRLIYGDSFSAGLACARVLVAKPSSQAQLVNNDGRVCAALQGSTGITLHCVDALILELFCHPTRLLHDQNSEFLRKGGVFLRWAARYPDRDFLGVERLLGRPYAIDIAYSREEPF